MRLHLSIPVLLVFCFPAWPLPGQEDGFNNQRHRDVRGRELQEADRPVKEEEAAATTAATVPGLGAGPLQRSLFSPLTSNQWAPGDTGRGAVALRSVRGVRAPGAFVFHRGSSDKDDPDGVPRNVKMDTSSDRVQFQVAGRNGPLQLGLDIRRETLVFDVGSRDMPALSQEYTSRLLTLGPFITQDLGPVTLGAEYRYMSFRDQDESAETGVPVFSLAWRTGAGQLALFHRRRLRTAIVRPAATGLIVKVDHPLLETAVKVERILNEGVSDGALWDGWVVGWDFLIPWAPYTWEFYLEKQPETFRDKESMNEDTILAYKALLLLLHENEKGILKGAFLHFGVGQADHQSTTVSRRTWALGFQLGRQI